MPRGCKLGQRYHRKRKEGAPWKSRRMQRYDIMRDVAGYTSQEAFSAYTDPTRFADAMRARGHDPSQWPDLIEVRLGGNGQRRNHPIAKRNTAWYHELRRLGADAAMASEYCKSPSSFERAKRILAGEEVE